MVSCGDYERVLRGSGGEIPVYAGTITQRGGFAIGGLARGIVGSVLPLVKSAIGNAVKRNVKGVIMDKMQGMSLQDSLRKRGREELGRVMRNAADVVTGPPPPKKRKTMKKTKKTPPKKATSVKRGKRVAPTNTPRVDIFG